MLNHIETTGQKLKVINSIEEWKALARWTDETLMNILSKISQINSYRFLLRQLYFKDF